MPREAACPSREELRLLLLDRIPELEAGPLESHLEGCGRCLGAVRSLPAEDALVEAVRAQRGVEDRPEDEAVRTLIERLQARPPARLACAPRTVGRKLRLVRGTGKGGVVSESSAREDDMVLALARRVDQVCDRFEAAWM